MPRLSPIFLLGATGVGKSAVAMGWARRVGGAILALDAMQVYRGADIGTGKPTAAERAEIPHGGLDLVEFGADFDVARYVEHAIAFLREQREAGRPVLIVGGTGLYFRALTRGLCEAPRGSEKLRAELRGLSTAELRARLGKVDPGMLSKLDGGNPRRLARAIEVMESTGRSLRGWQEETTAPAVAKHTAFWLQRDKKEMHARIETRIGQMFAAGWVEEVRGLVARHGAEAVCDFPAIGYKEIEEALASGVSPETARGDILVATRQYAKRQLTWFAREPTLQKVMLSGDEPFPADLLSLS